MCSTVIATAWATDAAAIDCAVAVLPVEPVAVVAVLPADCPSIKMTIKLILMTINLITLNYNL